MNKPRSVRKRSTFRRRDNARHIEAAISRALRNRLSGKIAKEGK